MIWRLTLFVRMVVMDFTGAIAVSRNVFVTTTFDQVQLYHAVVTKLDYFALMVTQTQMRINRGRT